jgi:hypothetical protein
MKINLTKLLTSPTRISPTFINKHNTDAAYLPLKDQTIKLSDSPYMFEMENDNI